MQQTQKYTYTLAAGETRTLDVQGSFYIVLAAQATITVTRDDGSKLANLLVDQGEAVDFKKLTIKNDDGANANTVTIIIGGSRFLNNRVRAALLCGNPAAVFSPAPAGLWNVLGADSTRRWLAIQNNDPAVTIWVMVGANASIGGGIKVRPGEYWEPNVVPLGSVSIYVESNCTGNIAVLSAPGV
jgi:hypothetical protein